MGTKHKKPSLTINAGQAVAALGVVQKLMAHPFEDIADIFAIRRAYAILNQNTEIAALDSTRVELVKTHGVKTDIGINVPPERLYDFASDYQKVAGHDIELATFTLPRSALASAAKAKLLTPQDIATIEPFLSE